MGRDVYLEGTLGHFEATVVQIYGVYSRIGCNVVDGVGAVVVVIQIDWQITTVWSFHVNFELTGSSLTTVHVEVRGRFGFDVLVETGTVSVHQGWI